MRNSILMAVSGALLGALLLGCDSVPQKSAQGGVLSGTEVERQRYNVRQTPVLAGNGPQEVVGQSSAAPTTHQPIAPAMGTRAPGPVAPGAAAPGAAPAAPGAAPAAPGGTTGSSVTTGSNAGGGAGTAATPPGAQTNTNPVGTPNDTTTGRTTGANGTGR